MGGAAGGGEVAEVLLFLGVAGAERDACADVGSRAVWVGLRSGVGIVRLRDRVVGLLVGELVGLRAVWILLELVKLRLVGIWLLVLVVAVLLGILWELLWLWLRLHVGILVGGNLRLRSVGLGSDRSNWSNRSWLEGLSRLRLIGLHGLRLRSSLHLWLLHGWRFGCFKGERLGGLDSGSGRSALEEVDNVGAVIGGRSRGNCGLLDHLHLLNHLLLLSRFGQLSSRLLEGLLGLHLHLRLLLLLLAVVISGGLVVFGVLVLV